MEAAKRFERTMPVTVMAVDRELAEIAAMLKTEYGLRLGDALAAALSKERKANLVTSDEEFRALEREITISWIR